MGGADWRGIGNGLYLMFEVVILLKDFFSL